MKLVQSALFLTLVTIVPLAISESATDTLNRLRTKANEIIPKELSSLVMLSDLDEIASGREVAAAVLAIAPPVSDAELQRNINLVGRWVASQSERPDLPWHFVVIDSPDINAFAVPGGYVLVTRGLYESLSGASELAGVLSHEIAHIVARHHIKAAVSSKLIAEGSRRAAELIAPGKETLFTSLLGAGASLLTHKLDQQSEFEADRMAVVLAGRAGFDPFGLPAVLARLETVSPNDSRISMLFRTHPTPKNRLGQLDSAMGDRFLEAGFLGSE